MLQNMAEALREGIGMSSVMSEKMSEEMSEKENAILELLTVQPQMTAVMLASVLGVTSRTAERYLRSLQTKGKLKRLGARKGGSWQVMA
jgi:predicted HTH transcriptional regulator